MPSQILAKSLTVEFYEEEFESTPARHSRAEDAGGDNARIAPASPGWLQALRSEGALGRCARCCNDRMEPIDQEIDSHGLLKCGRFPESRRQAIGLEA